MNYNRSRYNGSMSVAMQIKLSCTVHVRLEGTLAFSLVLSNWWTVGSADLMNNEASLGWVVLYRFKKTHAIVTIYDGARKRHWIKRGPSLINEARCWKCSSSGLALGAGLAQSGAWNEYLFQEVASGKFKTSQSVRCVRFFHSLCMTSPLRIGVSVCVVIHGPRVTGAWRNVQWITERASCTSVTGKAQTGG